MTKTERKLIEKSLDCQQAGKRLGVSHLTISNMIRKGALNGMMIRGKWYIPKQSIARHLMSKEPSRRKESENDLSFKQQVRELRRLTPGQAAVILGVSRQRIEQLSKNKLLKSYPCGPKLRMIDIHSVVARLGRKGGRNEV